MKASGFSHTTRVVRENKTTTKVCVVFDAATQTQAQESQWCYSTRFEVTTRICSTCWYSSVALLWLYQLTYLRCCCKLDSERKIVFSTGSCGRVLRLPENQTSMSFTAFHSVHLITVLCSTRTHVQAHATEYPNGAETVTTRSMWTTYWIGVRPPKKPTFTKWSVERLRKGGFNLRKWSSNE